MAELSDDVAAHREWLLSFVPFREGIRVVDLGCGTGDDLIALAARYPRVPAQLLGVDSSAASTTAAAEQSRADERLSFRQHRLGTDLPFSDGSFEVVYSNNLLECLGDREAFLQEVARVLTPDGMVVIAHWDWDSQVFDGSDKARIRRLMHAFADWQQPWMDHADGWMGRRLWGACTATGLFTGTVHARVLTNTVFAAPWYGYARAQDLRSLVKRGLAASDDCEQFLQEQTALAHDGRYFYSITGYVFVGTRVPSG